MPLDLWADGIHLAPSEQAYWDGQSVLTGADRGTAPADNQVQRSAVQVVFDRTTPAAIQDDQALFSLNFVLQTLDFGTSIISAGNKATVEGLLNTWWTAAKALTPSHWTLREYRWHDFTESWTKPGPATRVTAVGSVATGSSTNAVPDQVATSMTFKTSSRIHWGRCYLPGLITSSYTSTGRISTATVDALAAALRTALVGADSAGITPVVPSTSHRANLAISSIQVDDTPDVIRSRRAKRPSYRKTYTS